MILDIYLTTPQVNTVKIFKLCTLHYETPETIVLQIFQYPSFAVLLLLGACHDDVPLKKNTIRTPSPPTYSQNYERSKDSSKSEGNSIEKRSVLRKSDDNQKNCSARIDKFEKNKNVCSSGPRTPPTPKNKDSLYKRTGPRTPSPQPFKLSPEKRVDNEMLNIEEQCSKR